MKIIQVVLIVLLLGTSGLYLYERKLRISAQSEMLNASAQAEEALNRCEERLADQRLAFEEQLQQRQTADSVQALRDVQESLRDQRLRTQDQTLQEVAARLELDDESRQLLRSALNRFNAGKRQLVTQTRAEGTFLSATHMQGINELRQGVLTILAELLTAEQYQQFVQDGYAERLDLVTVPVDPQ